MLWFRELRVAVRLMLPPELVRFPPAPMFRLELSVAVALVTPTPITPALIASTLAKVPLVMAPVMLRPLAALRLALLDGAMVRVVLLVMLARLVATEIPATPTALAVPPEAV